MTAQPRPAAQSRPAAQTSRSEKFSDAGYAAGWRAVRLLPERVARGGFDLGADLAWRRGAGQGQLRANLARVMGSAPERVPDALIRASLRSYARYWREAFRLPSMDLARMAADVDSAVQGQEHLNAAMDAGRGAVLVLPHSGNWDVAGVWLVHAWGQFATVAERLKPESLFQRFVDYRERLGFEVFPLSGGEEPPFGALRSRLEQGKVVCLLGERDLTGRGIPVDFFGERTSMPAGPARLAAETGAALLPVHCWFTDGGWGFSIAPPVDASRGVEAATQSVADVFAANIAAHPADWHMLQPLWWSDLSDERRARLGIR
ncbi:phosphatidylinositol mannoside acyltransferase [Tomitella gaofuii]|uniref:phosphatidylinositol mannoside acyltransferase n=1 Tax=Tomitella gaofuii TaxID=2760083 RepID=UPI0015F7E7F4|nr:phosphatidylinositol mannoside acyltransferase [Tomitella gaofuii]